MASRKELKKNINYIAGELFTECLVNSLYVLSLIHISEPTRH